MKTTIRTNKEKQNIISRINRISGQVNGVKQMIENSAYCIDIVNQLIAIENATKSLSNLILNEHIYHCLKNSIKTGDETTLDELSNLIRKLR